MYDMIVLLPFIAVLASSRRWFFGSTVALGFFVGELHSAMPFGFFSLSYALSLAVLSFAIRSFNLSSPASIALVFFVVIILFTLTTTVSYATYHHMWNSETALRGIVWGIRQFLAGAIVSLVWWSCIYSLSLIRNAFVEEKISYS